MNAAFCFKVGAVNIRVFAVYASRLNAGRLLITDKSRVKGAESATGYQNKTRVTRDRRPTTIGESGPQDEISRLACPIRGRLALGIRKSDVIL